MTREERAARQAELRRQYRNAKARELEARGEPELAAEVLAGRCACGCKVTIAGGNVRTFYAGDRCRKRADRRSVEALAAAAGVPAHLSRRSLEAMNGTPQRPADAQERPTLRRRPLPGVRVYFPTVALAADLLRFLEDVEDMGPIAREVAAELRPALERRRARAT